MPHLIDKTTILSKFETEIDDIVNESEHVYKNTIDYEFMDQRFIQLLKMANQEGLDDKIIWALISKRIPSYINYINANLTRKRTA